MAREAVRDIDAVTQRLIDRGLLRQRIRHGTVIPVFGVDREGRRRYGLE